MNEVIKQKWVAALRSGDYKQGVGSLKFKGKHCCLGVLCDLYIKDEQENGGWDENEDFIFVDDEGFESSEASTLPPMVQQWVGLKNENPIIGEQSLTWHNDGPDMNSRGKSFVEIAKLIEENL